MTNSMVCCRTSDGRRRSVTPSTFLVTVLLAVAVGMPGVPSPIEGQQPGIGPGAYVFQDVTVIPMDTDRTLPNHAVVVSDRRIEAVGPVGSVDVPADAEVIDGRGRYLLPGLVDMRIHLPAQSDPMRVLVVDEFLFLFLANGVTTVRGVGGASYQLELRDQSEAGEILAPLLLIGSPDVNATLEPGSEGELVSRYSEERYDFLSIESGLPERSWEAVVAAATDVDMPFAGPLPEGVGIERAIRDGIRSLERLDAFFAETRRAELPPSASFEDVVRATESARVTALAQQVAVADLFVVPAQYRANGLEGWNHIFRTAGADSIVELPEFRYVSMGQRDEWVTASWTRMANASVTEASARAYGEWRERLVGTLHGVGSRLLVGTDAPALFTVPGFAVHREMGALAAAGLTPYETLEAATRNAAEYAAEVLGEPGDFGTIIVGNRADLLLLDENPLESLEALEEARAGVMVGGWWLPGSEIEERLASIAERYAEFETD